MTDLLALMHRRIEHRDLDQPASVARFIADMLSEVDDRDIAGLLGVDPKTIANWRTGRVGPRSARTPTASPWWPSCCTSLAPRGRRAGC